VFFHVWFLLVLSQWHSQEIVAFSPPLPPPTSVLRIRQTQETIRRESRHRVSIMRIPATALCLASSSSPAGMDVVFGSDSVSGGGSNWGVNDDEDDDEEEENDATTISKTTSAGNNNREKARRQHQALVETLLKESDDEFREERKRRLWGKFANVTDSQELQDLLKLEETSIQAENARKAALAAASGISLEMLDPKESSSLDSSGNTLLEEDGGNIQISIGSSTKRNSWFAEMDEDILSEWQALTAGDVKDVSLGGGVDEEDDDMDENDTDSNNINNNIVASDTATTTATGGGGNKMVVAREALAGIRVGSAGTGWSLEVFPGDFVVHRKYGIGRFEGTKLRSKTRLSPDEIQARDERRAELLTLALRQLQKQQEAEQQLGKSKPRQISPEDIQEIRSKFGTAQDLDPISNPQTAVLEISYADVVVHVPVDRAYRLSRYRAGDAIVKPKLSRVKGMAWAKAKRNVQQNTIQLAQDVLALYATRETTSRPPFDPSFEAAVQEFETTFKFTATPDQIKCFEDVENDMVWRGRPMDRLVCGDVGFGKTEVAIRALYRCVKNGRQAAFLAPTGVLAAQHFKNVVQRMGEGTPYNVKIAFLRGGMGKRTKLGRALRLEIESGQAQLIVGTHALLGNDLKFKDLGLLVVDEEQRFGVKQKERLKLLSHGVDVLTMSATPIPRTLQMSLSGIRDTTPIRSPPPMRKPTITYVQDFSEEIAKKAIEQELARGGQCYYVVPRISMIDEAQEMIQRLFPSVRVIQAHGRMQRNGAEANVAAFAEGNYDVLLATTVIENGVDIPSVNTIIVQNSQAFGMSTLYQLRGRVGRSDKQAYAYFLHREESITEQAVMRLQAIGELNELGSGFDVANRDLEIRGAGSLLGTEQSGMAAKVGFDLYMRMLKKSIRQMRGLDLPLVPRTNVLLATDGSPDTFSIPEDLIPDVFVRRREESAARLAESTVQLVNLTNTWKESYGALPSSLQSQLKTMHLHACTRRLGIDLVGLVENGEETADGDAESKNMDVVLRSPGLRPRHWATIVSMFPRGIPPPGLNVCFPARFTVTGVDEEIAGGRKIDLKELLTDATLGDDAYDVDGNGGLDDDDDWDAMDQEEIEAMKDIASVVNVRHMDEVDLEQYPRFVIKNVASSSKKQTAQQKRALVDRILKSLLPVAKVVYEKQQEQAEQANGAAQLRERQELLKSRKKASKVREPQQQQQQQQVGGYRY
jgi:transcription-repair coupling factor (superfamily II helicase)